MWDLKEKGNKDDSWVFDLRSWVGVKNRSQISFVVLVGVYLVDSEGDMAFGHTMNLASWTLSMFFSRICYALKEISVDFMYCWKSEAF